MKKICLNCEKKINTKDKYHNCIKDFPNNIEMLIDVKPCKYCKSVDHVQAKVTEKRVHYWICLSEECQGRVF